MNILKFACIVVLAILAIGTFSIEYPLFDRQYRDVVTDKCTYVYKNTQFIYVIKANKQCPTELNITIQEVDDE